MRKLANSEVKDKGKIAFKVEEGQEDDGGCVLKGCRYFP